MRGARALSIHPRGKVSGELREREEDDAVVAPRRLPVRRRVVAPGGEKEPRPAEGALLLHVLEGPEPVFDEPQALAVAAAGQPQEDRALRAAGLLAVDVRGAERDTLSREERAREPSFLRRHDGDADRRAGKAAEALDRARVEAMALEPADLVLRDPRVADAVELGADYLAHASEVGEPRLGAPVPRQLGLRRPGEQGVDQHGHLPAGLHEGPEAREAVEEPGGRLGWNRGPERPVGAPRRLEVLAHPVAEDAVEVE